MPVWIADLIGLEGLRGEGAVTVAPAFVDVAGLHVRGAGGDVRGEFDRRGRSTRGVALAKSGILTVGLELHDGATSLKLFGADDWYRRALAARATQGWN